MELLEGMEARDVYLTLSRLETRFNIHIIQIIQIFSDSGTQLAAAILGEKKSFYQERLGRLWAVTNNTPYSQFRNVAERKISMLKKIMKQVLSGLPGPQRVCMDRDILAAAMLRASSVVNNIPYLELGENTRLLAPADFITPWRTDQPGVRPVPESNLDSLKDAKRRLQIIQERMAQVVREEIQTSGLERRFRQARLRLGKNHSGADISVGDLVLIGLPNQPPEICFVENAEVRDVTLRTPGGRGIGLPNGKENEGHLYAPHHRHPPPEGRRGSKGAGPAPRVDSEVCRHCWGDIWPDAHLPRVRMGGPWNYLG